MTGLDGIRSHKDTPLAIRVVAGFVMFQLVCIGWIFFRATPAELLPSFKSIVGYWDAVDWNFVTLIGWGLTLYSVPLCITEFMGYHRNCEFVDLYDKWSWFTKTAVYVAIFYAALMFGARKQSEFIYFQF